MKFILNEDINTYYRFVLWNEDTEEYIGLFKGLGQYLEELWEADDKIYDDFNRSLSQLEYALEVPDLDFKHKNYNFAFKKKFLDVYKEEVEDIEYYIEEYSPFTLEIQETRPNNIIYEDDLQVAYIVDKNMNENLLFNKKDLEINLDKFKNGESNVLLITGFSGSGKSSLAKKLALKYNAIHYELDCLDFYLYNNINIENLIGAEDGLVEFINTYKIEPTKDIKNIDYLYKEYIKFLINYCKGHSNKKYIIEGIQIYEDYESGDTYITDCPIIIKGTSGIISAIRAAKRDTDGNKNIKFLHYLKPLIRWAIKDNEFLNNFTSDIKLNRNSP